MHQIRISKTARFAAALGCVTAAACSSGGGGGSPTTVSVPVATPSTAPGTTTSTTGSSSAASPGDIFDTGIAGSIGMPVSASFGSAAPQPAVAGGPTFDGSSGSYPKNATFPLIVSSFQKTFTGFSAAGDVGATATVVSTSASASVLQLTIPSLGVNQTMTFNTNLVSHLGQVTDGLSYVVMGQWIQRPTANVSSIQSQSAFVFGYETPSTAMPASGTAVFAATPGSAAAYIYKSASGEVQGAYAEGNAAFTVNFTSGQVAGSITNMQLLNSKQPWNDVSVSASIVPGTNRFGGTTAVTSSPASLLSLSSSASGRIDGAFFGPAAQNLGAVWSISDGTVSALGTITSGH